MTGAVIESGDKLHIITRSNFKEDLRRHFAGTVLAASESQVRVQGYAFVFKRSSSMYRRRPELRTRIFGISDPQLIVFVLPPEVSIERLNYTVDSYNGRLTLTDGLNFQLDMNEFGDESEAR